MTITVWACQVCGQQNRIIDATCTFCGLPYGTEKQNYDTQIDDIDGLE